jgi:hypothetical protein
LVLQAWLLPYLKRMAKQQDQAREALRSQLAREPTVEAVLAQLGLIPELLLRPTRAARLLTMLRRPAA